MQAWKPSDLPASPGAPTANHDGVADEITFGPGVANNTSFDQLAAHNQMFGVTMSFDEEDYATKLDKFEKKQEEAKAKARYQSNYGGMSSNARALCCTFKGILTNLAEYRQQSTYSRGENSESR